MLLLIFLALSATAQPIAKTTTSQYPYGSCGIKNKNQLASAISPYQSPMWSTTNTDFLLTIINKGCQDRSLDCGSAPCLSLCKESLQRVDAIHVPINSACVSRMFSQKDCSALVVTNMPGAARYRFSSNDWAPVSLDFNSCNGTVTQARLYTKGIVFSAAHRLLQFAIPKSLFDLSKCPLWKNICQSSNAYSKAPFCAVAPYLNSGTGGHEFCPVIPSVIF
jgi:hypothetical protein